MINSNGTLHSEKDFSLNINNRGFRYGDAVFDTLKSFKNNIYFIEDHYFRLMSSMRMLRMEIPDHFTLEFYRDEIIKTLNTGNIGETGRIRFTVSRKDGGLYLPETNKIDYLIECSNLNIKEKDTYETELYKDFQVLSGNLSNVKTNNRILNVTASIFADENGYDNCILINEKKHIVEAINANIFLIRDYILYTPPLSDGPVNGIIRKKFIEFIKKEKVFKIVEKELSPMDLLQADEVFLTNSIIEFQNVTKHRKKIYTDKISSKLKKEFFEFYSEDQL